MLIRTLFTHRFDPLLDTRYITALYPVLYAAGAVWLEGWVGPRLLRWAWAAAAAVVSLVLLPVLLPVLPADVMARSTALTSVTAAGDRCDPGAEIGW